MKNIYIYMITSTSCEQNMHQNIYLPTGNYNVSGSYGSIHQAAWERGPWRPQKPLTPISQIVTKFPAVLRKWCAGDTSNLTFDGAIHQNVSKPKNVIFYRLLVLGMEAASLFPFFFFRCLFALFSPSNPANRILPISGWLRHSSTRSMKEAMVVTLDFSRDKV